MAEIDSKELNARKSIQEELIATAETWAWKSAAQHYLGRGLEQGTPPIVITKQVVKSLSKKGKGEQM